MTLAPRRAQTILRRFPRQDILVVGDLMLDRYIYGSVSRISPEAPVPVVAVDREVSMPGGAGNVAANILALGARARVAGLMGMDAAGAELVRRLRRDGVRLDGVRRSRRLATVAKTRVVAERQQVVRVDFDGPAAGPGPVPELPAALLRRALRGVTGVILEDYGKGALAQSVVDTVLAAARRRGIPVGLDPKPGHALRLAGLTVATPNRKEAFALAGAPETRPAADPLRDRPLLHVGAALLRLWDARLLVITLGAQGMLLLSPGQPPRHVPTRAREVFDVSGAGDTAIAACVTALAAGASFVEAAELANYAAGVVVGKLGTATCAPRELLRQIRRQGGAP